jgi:hypothetical protein
MLCITQKNKSQNNKRNKDNGKCEDKHRGNSCGQTREQKQPKKVEVSMNNDGAANHHITIT